MSKQRDTKLLTNITIDPNRFKPEKNRRYVDNKRGEDALDKVVRDMANVFYNLKNGIFLVQSAQLNKKESINNIESELETIYKKQEEINRLKEKELKEKKQVQNTKKHQKKINSSVNNTNNQNESNQFAKGQIKASSNGNNAKNQPTTPNSSSLNKSNQGQIINVKNLRFPPENTQNINAKTVAVNPGNNLNRQNSSGNPSLRKPQQNANKVVSVPQPREIYNPLGILKDEVDRAIKDKKTFTIKGNFSAVRKALLKRGWVEKYHPIFRNRLNDDIKRYQNFSVQELVDLLRNKDLADTIKKMIKSKLLSDHQVDLYWDHNYDAFKECSDKKKLTIINRFRRGSLSYTSKQGLCQAAREAHWLHIPGIAQINHPRCYVLAKGGDTKTFLQDFGLTAAISLLKWVVKNNITEECKVVSETGKIPMKCFDFAIAECYKYLKKEQHQDIDEHIKDAMEIEWNAFLDQFYKAVHVGNHFKLKDKTVNPSQEAKDMVRQANYLLNQLREYRPCMDMDGYMNIWILKPINSSRGLGIHICRTLQVILDIIKDNPNRRYVIQKYIERPLLIHETKFDIRQWFLVTCSYPLTIWIYKICYLRFSSQTYNLRKLHESIHLTNNSVQAKYLKVGNMDPLLARHGMWDSNQFKNYLSDIGYPTIFENVIYPGMKQCITGAMIAHKDKIDKRGNCFELYGADFMLSETFEPWMLEINSNPALHPSTPVTAKLCPEVLEDVIKVVVDSARNPHAGTGNFELIYRENVESKTVNAKENLEISGSPLPNEYFCDIPTFESSTKCSTASPKEYEYPDPGKFLMQTGETMKHALKTLLDLVKREKIKRRSRKEKSIEVKSEADDSSIQTNSEFVSLYQSASILKTYSNHSVQVVGFDSKEEMSADDSRKITEVFGEIISLHNKKDVLSSLVKVVDTLKNARKIPKSSL